MSKFEVGDELTVVTRPDYWKTDWKPQVGDTCKVKSVDDVGVYIECRGYAEDHHFELAENRSTWHPHHDVIVAWAKGAKIRGRKNSESSWLMWGGNAIGAPEWRPDWEYEVIPEPDHTAEIADIERKMRELSDAQKELADRLEKIR